MDKVCPQCWKVHDGGLSYAYPLVSYSIAVHPLIFCSSRCLFRWEDMLPACEYCRIKIHGQHNRDGYCNLIQYRDKYFCMDCWTFIACVMPIDKKQGKMIKIWRVVTPVLANLKHS